MQLLSTLFAVGATVLLAAQPVLAQDDTNGQQVLFFISPVKDRCSWGPSNSFPAGNQTSNGGICAYIPKTNRLFACPAPDPTCWTFLQTCKGGTNTPGSDQILCGSSTSNQWCCNENETCTVTSGQINICISKFANPNAGLSASEAQAKEYSILPSASIGTSQPAATPSAFSTRGGSSSASTTGGSTAGTSGATSAPQQSNGSSSSSSSGISGGAIAGIVVGVIVVIAIVVGAVIFLILHKRKQRANAGNVGAGELPPKSGEGYYGQPGTPAPEYSAANHGYNASQHGGHVYAKEVPDTQAPQELPAPVQRHELQ